MSRSLSIKDNLQLNVLGGKLKKCSCNDKNKITGFFRDGFCRIGSQDFGLHSVCCEVTNEFLQYSKSIGNDLITPVKEINFSGLKKGDHWCICLLRWKDAYEKGCAPKVILKSTNIITLSVINLEVLRKSAIDDL